MKESKYNSIRKWFLAAQDSGDFIGIRFGRVERGGGDPEWIYYPHCDVDGIGAFALILKERGAGFERLPQIKYYPAYSAVMSALKHWPRYLLPRCSLPFRPMRCDETGRLSAEAPVAVAWHVFAEEQTQKMRIIARHRGGTVNTFLLKHLTEAVRGSLVDGNVAMPWMIPVNMRGGVQQDDETDNHTSYVTVNVGSNESIGEVHRRILTNLSRGQHWGNWHAFKLGNCIPHGVRKWMVSTGRAISQWNVGAFSNLGDWDPEKRFKDSRLACDWLFAPPTLQTQRVAAGCVTFQGRMSVTLQIHPELTIDPDVAIGWVREWKDRVTADLR